MSQLLVTSYHQPCHPYFTNVTYFTVWPLRGLFNTDPCHNAVSQPSRVSDTTINVHTAQNSNAQNGNFNF